MWVWRAPQPITPAQIAQARKISDKRAFSVFAPIRAKIQFNSSPISRQSAAHSRMLPIDLIRHS